MLRPGRVISIVVSAVAAGVLACGAGVAPAQPPGPGEVDLYLQRGGAVLVPGGAVERPLTVINNGGDMTGDVELYYTTPVFVAIDEQKGLPPGCAIYYRGPDAQVPTVVKCTLSPLGAGQRHEVSIPIAILDGAPAVPTYGTAIVRPAKPDADRERNLVDNIARPGGTISLPPVAPAPGRVALDEAALAVLAMPALVPATPSTADYRVVNSGAAPAQNVRLIVVTPLYVNTSAAGALPAGCSMLLADPDPAVPEIVDCAIGNLAPSESRDVQIPIKAGPNGPAAEVCGTTVVTAEAAKPGIGSICGLLAR